MGLDVTSCPDVFLNVLGRTALLPQCLPRAEMAIEDCECAQRCVSCKEVKISPGLSLEQVFIKAGLGFQIIFLLMMFCLSPTPGATRAFGALLSLIMGTRYKTSPGDGASDYGHKC